MAKVKLRTLFKLRMIILKFRWWLVICDVDDCVKLDIIINMHDQAVFFYNSAKRNWMPSLDKYQYQGWDSL